MKKKLTMLAALVLVFALGVSGTLAYLTAKTDTVTNTFTVGNVKITLDETDSKQDNDSSALTNSYKMIPGNKIEKDPEVTVTAGSEACYVFVKLEKFGAATLEDGTKKSFDDFITYTVGSDWTELTGVDGVYYINQEDLTAEDAEDAVYSVLANDEVSVKGTVTQEMMDALSKTGAVQPNLQITAYAIQAANMTNAADAWTKLNAQG